MRFYYWNNYYLDDKPIKFTKSVLFKESNQFLIEVYRYSF